jgi:tetratricopeptide (TPR) repeat protein
MKIPEPSAKRSGRSRRMLFRIITLSLPLLILLLLEGFLRIVSYGDNPGLFIQNPKEGYSRYMILNPAVGRKYFRKLEYDAPPNDIFLKKKPEGTFRIFVMGSSTVVGFPYEENLMFSRILHKRLEDAFPERHIEMVNTAITAINSFTLLDYAGAVISQDPDAVLIYAGHNEFYGAFGVGSNESMSRSRMLTRIHLGLMNLRFYQLLRNIINSVTLKMGASGDEPVHGTLMQRVVADRDIPLDSDAYRLAMKRFRQNMGKLVRRFSEHGIPVFISEVVSNVKDTEPLSVTSSGKENEAWEAFAAARDAFAEGEYEKARTLYYRAKDLDGVRFRASEEVNRIIRDLSREYGAYTVPMLERFQAASPHGIIGNNLMTEHVHPNIEGNFLMADAFYSEILGSGLLGEVDTLSVHPAEYYRINWGYTALDSLLALNRISNLKTHWPFVPLDANLPDYRLTYHPRSEQDSIAFSVLRDPALFLDEMRLELAGKYVARGNHPAAYREYEALLRTNPYIAVNYRDAASSLIQLGDLPLALKYFKKSQEYEPSFYACYRMGEIYLIKGDYSGARKCFRDAFEITDNRGEQLKTLGKLYIACVYGNQEADAGAIAEQLRKYDAAQYLEIPPKTYVYDRYIPYQTRDQVIQAGQMIAGGDLPGALSILQGSLNIYDSHVARRCIGEILMRMNKPRAALDHFNRVYDEFAFDPEFLKEMTYLYITLDDLNRAETMFEMLKDLDPDNESIDIVARMLSQAE